MSDADIDPGILIFLDRRSNAQTAAVALIAEDEFARAQTIAPDLKGYSGYEEWRDSRESLQIGLSMAGVDAKLVPVALGPFLIWCRLTGTSPGERPLNAFASAILRFRTPPEPTVLAIIREQEFETHSRNVPALSEHGDYQQWLRHRQAIYAKTATRVEELPILIDGFTEWSACVNWISEPSIDRYAQLTLEYLAEEFKQ
jgi:hypothetical protein